MGNEKICMDMLSIKVSWSLFKRHAFENMNPMGHLELEVVGNQIAAKFKGLPLALKTLAGMLRSKSEVEVWKRILRSEIWELPDNDMLPVLMLSYNDLPAHLKQCFAYCAIYPKDYHFCKDQVIHLWFSNGLVQQLTLDSIYVLYSLETLLLSSCKDLEDLPLWMEMLINLHHLDISNTFCLKMPLHLSKLKSLYVLVGSKFLLGGRGGSRMEDLGELHYLYGSLSLLELQNVVDRKEALRANIREKATIGVE
ncbi:hypothetical protein CQW23_22165 [Capsicum baccatum]|uniref:Uncharacterized protein n=1 Tax=Capsicum baccatum TaxID=33114 RepID=A0A2G2W036_CAPBA|nr:hypothetical protein CQW23_22165 [Capsicum baccatum]